MKIVILNTGCANLYSIMSSIKKIGYNAEISSDKKTILKADRIFLPGIGTAKSAMNQLKYFKLIELIRLYKNPILGICLGMQLLGKDSEENGTIKTLNIINT